MKSRKRYSLKLSLKKIKWENYEKLFSADRKEFTKKSKGTALIDPRSKDILKLLAAGTMIALTIYFPTLPMAIAPFVVDRRKFTGWKLNQKIKRLRQQKLVKIKQEQGVDVVIITDKGKVRALRYKLEEMEIAKTQRWDKKWRVVIFDIPEKAKRLRDIFRHHLKILGFYQLQKSVWVHAYPCFDEIEFLRQIFHVGVDVTYILADRIENSSRIEKFFKLS